MSKTSEANPSKTNPASGALALSAESPLPPAKASSPVSSSPVMEALARRGIADEARALTWRVYDYHGEAVMRYPVWDGGGRVIGHRITALTPQARELMPNRAKYVWSPSKPSSVWANWYVPPDARNEIARAGGVVWLANGEKSVLAMRAAGLKNVIATTHTETADPVRLGVHEVMRALGVQRLINVPDNDPAGWLGAKKWGAPLHELGIAYELRRWHSEAKGYDANDLWIETGFDAGLFATALEALAQVPLSAISSPARSAPAKGKGDKGYVGALAGDAESAALAREILQRGTGDSAPAFKANGFTTKNYRCPFHEDDTPSAGYTASGGLYCFAGCGYKHPHEVADRLGIARDSRSVMMRVTLPTPDVKRTFDQPTTATPAIENPATWLVNGIVVEPATAPATATPMSNVVALDDIDVLDGAQEALKANGAAMTWAELFRDRRDLPMWLHSALNVVNSLDALLARHVVRLVYTEPSAGGLSADALTPLALSARTVFDSEQWVAHMRRYEGVLYERSVSRRGGRGRPSACWQLKSVVDEAGFMLLVVQGVARLLYHSPSASPADSALVVDDARYGYSDEFRVAALNPKADDELKAVDKLRDEFLARFARRLQTINGESVNDEVGEGALLSVAPPPLPVVDGWEDMNAPEYRRAYLEARVREAGAMGLNVTQRRLSLELGVNEQTVGRLLSHLPVKICQNEHYAELKRPRALSAGNVADALEVIARRYAGRLLTLVVLKPSERMKKAVSALSPTQQESVKGVIVPSEILRVFPISMGASAIMKVMKDSYPEAIFVVKVKRANTYIHHDHLAADDLALLAKQAEEAQEAQDEAVEAIGEAGEAVGIEAEAGEEARETAEAHEVAQEGDVVMSKERDKATAKKPTKRKSSYDPAQPPQPPVATRHLWQVLRRGRSVRVWYPQIDNNPKNVRTGHEVAMWWLTLTNMSIDHEGYLIASRTGERLPELAAHMQALTGNEDETFGHVATYETLHWLFWNGRMNVMLFVNPDSPYAVPAIVYDAATHQRMLERHLYDVDEYERHRAGVKGDDHPMTDDLPF